MEKITNLKPKTYWGLTLGITWISLFIAAYFSYTPDLLKYKNIFILIALFTPFLVSVFMILLSRNKEILKDFKERLFNIKLINKKGLLFTLLLMPIVLLLATSISLLFGQPISQFNISPELTSFSGEILIIMIILILAPTFEELGWRGYGIKSIEKGRSILKITIIFSILWTLWHVPLYFIDGYYQNELINTSYIYALNFVVQIFVASIIMDFLYYKNNKSIILMILFHIMLNFYSVLLQTEQFTKCIITILLGIVTFYILHKEKTFFNSKID